MAGPRKKLGKFAGIVLLSGFVSFFTFISLIDASFFTHLWLPFLALHYILALIVLFIHKKRDKQQGEKTKTGLFLLAIFCALSTGVSIINISIIISLCADPYCREMRSTSTDRIIVYTIIIIFEYFNLCTFFDFCAVKFAGTRNLLYRLVISFPVSLHVTTCVFSSFVLWLYPIAAYFAAKYQSDQTQFASLPYLPVIIYLLVYLFSINGLYNSLFTKWSYIYINMKNIIKNPTISNIQSQEPEEPLLDDQKQQQQTNILSNNNNNNNRVINKNPNRCHPKEYRINKSQSSSHLNDNNSIRICQITDPHIGPMMSVKRLQRICQDIVAKDPDLVLLTGDYFTGEADMDGLLLKAFEPLKPINYKCFACLGNHDVESDAVYNRTINELKILGIKLLRNESIVYDKITRIGPIQIIGYDYIFHQDRDRGKKLRSILNENQCPQECRNRRIVLLHDPGGFKCFEGDENLIVFSGHTHGGHCGIISCGIDWTFFYQFLRLPDNGLWSKGNNKLYVHRGQGSRALYGNYVLRCGVPTEQSVVHIEW